MFYTILKINIFRKSEHVVRNWTAKSNQVWSFCHESGGMHLRVVAGLQLHNIELGPDQYFAIFRQWQGPAVSLSCTVYNLNGDMFYVWTEYNKLPTEVSKIWLRIRSRPQSSGKGRRALGAQELLLNIFIVCAFKHLRYQWLIAINYSSV